MRRRAAALLLAAALLPACERTTPEQRAAETAVEPYLNVIAQQIAELPTVTCARVLLPDGGIPGGAQSDVVDVSLKLDLALDDPDVATVLEQAGELVWRSPVPLSELGVSAFGGTVSLGPDGRRAAEADRALDVGALTGLYGPRPGLPASLPPVQDPGAQRC